MNVVAGPIVSYRRYWIPELTALALLVLCALLLFFSAANPDLAAAGRFYHPGQIETWPLSSQPLWTLLYRAAPWITGSLALTGVVLIVLGLLREGSKRLRLYGLFILLCIVLGPGLFVNAVFKDHWGRPRPRQTVEFGGQFPYVQPLVPSRSGGKSFPCGDASVGFLYAAGWWIWRRDHFGRAALSLAAGLTLGTLLDLGRMAAGAHFLSDVVWSALIVFCVCHVLYYYVLRVPAREDSRIVMYPLMETSPRVRTATIAASCLLGAGIIGGGIFANPVDRDLAARIRFADYAASPEQLEVTADTLDVDLQLVERPGNEIECAGAVHSFGLPKNDIKQTWEFDRQPIPTLRYRVVQKGLFTDIDGVAHLRVPVEGLRKIVVRVKRGNITVSREANAAASARVPVLDLATANGRVQGL